MEAVGVHRILRSGCSWRCLWTGLYAALLLASPDSVCGENPTATPEGAAQQGRSEEAGLSAVEQDWLRQAEASTRCGVVCHAVRRSLRKVTQPVQSTASRTASTPSIPTSNPGPGGRST